MKHEITEATDHSNRTDFSDVLPGLNMVSSGLEVNAQIVGPDSEPFSIRSLEGHSKLRSEGAFVVTLGDNRAILRRVGKTVSWGTDPEAGASAELDDDQKAKMESITVAALKHVQERRHNRTSLLKSVATNIVHAAVSRN